MAEYSVWKCWYFLFRISIKKLKCLNVIRISFVPRKIRYNYIFHKYCSFPYRLQKLKKTFLLDAHVKTFVRIFETLANCWNILNSFRRLLIKVCFRSASAPSHMLQGFHSIDTVVKAKLKKKEKCIDFLELQRNNYFAILQYEICNLRWLRRELGVSRMVLSDCWTRIRTRIPNAAIGIGIWVWIGAMCTFNMLQL